MCVRLCVLACIKNFVGNYVPVNKERSRKIRRKRSKKVTFLVINRESFDVVIKQGKEDHCIYQTDKPGIFGRCGLTAVFGVLFDHWPIIQCCTVSTCVYAVYSFLIFWKSLDISTFGMLIREKKILLPRIKTMAPSNDLYGLCVL